MVSRTVTDNIRVVTIGIFSAQSSMVKGNSEASWTLSLRQVAPLKELEKINHNSEN